MKLFLIRILAIAAAGSVGAVARYIISRLFALTGWTFPIGTLVINISGSLFLGWFMEYASTRNVSSVWTLAVGVGFVGAYTTFSTYMYESVRLMGRDAWTEALLNLFGSLLLGVIAAQIGISLARKM